MKIRTQLLWILPLLALGLSIFGGCGGGSSGTGGQVYQGIIQTQDASPVGGVQVTIIASGSSATTDSAGVFAVATQSLSGDIELGLAGQGLSTSAVVPGVEGDATLIEVTIQVNLQANTAETTRVNIERPASSSSRSSARSSDGQGSSQTSSMQSSSAQSSGGQSSSRSSNSSRSGGSSSLDDDSSSSRSRASSGGSSSDDDDDDDDSSSSRSRSSRGSSSSDDD